MCEILCIVLLTRQKRKIEKKLILHSRIDKKQRNDRNDDDLSLKTNKHTQTTFRFVQ